MPHEDREKFPIRRTETGIVQDAEGFMRRLSQQETDASEEPILSALRELNAQDPRKPTKPKKTK